jgi:hypothetical protein
MDPAVQSVWLNFNHHKIGSSTQGATLGAFVLGGICREWTPLLSREESRLRLGSLLTQIIKAAEHGSCVAIPSQQLDNNSTRPCGEKEEGASYHYSLLERSGKRRSILLCN